MRANEANISDAGGVVNRDNEAVSISFNVENDAVVSNEARISVDGLLSEASAERTRRDSPAACAPVFRSHAHPPPPRQLRAT